MILTGCQTTRDVVVTKTETKVIELPLHLKKKCPVTVPPDIVSYPKLTYQQKEEVLTTYTINLLGDLRNCNQQIDEIVRFEKDQIKNIKDNAK